jgi:glycosyltransferase involved in cell wall biosynthesis
MNIWFINHYALPPDKAGGTRHYSLAKELVRLGHKVTIIASSFDYFSQTETKLSVGESSKRETVDGVDFIWLRTPPYKGNSLGRIRNMLSFTFDIWREKSCEHLPRPDVIYGSSPHLFAAYSAYRVAKRKKIPFVLEVRDIWPQSLVDIGSISPGHPLVRLLTRLEKTLYTHATHVVTLLPFAHEHIVQKGGRPDAITWVSNGIDLRLVPAPEEPKATGKFNIFYTGAHGVANALDVLVETANEVQHRPDAAHIHFTLVGEGPEKIKLKETAKQYGLTNITFRDSVPKRSLYTLAQEADAFVALVRDSVLYKHGISFNKFFDYLAMARPVLMASSARNNPVGEAGAALTVPPDDPKALAEAVFELCSYSLEKRSDMGMRGRSYVEEHYSFEKLAKKLEVVFTDVLARKR